MGAGVLASFTTKDWLADRWLSDVVLTRQDGSERPASFYAGAIRGAIAEVARAFSIELYPSSYIDEAKDTVEWSPVSYWLTRLRHRPVAEVTRLSVFNGNIRVYDLPVGRCHYASRLHAQIQIVPSNDALQLLNPMTFTDLWPYGPYQPGALRVSYTAGFEAALTGTVSTSGVSTLTGVGTAFLSELENGDLVQVGTSGEARQVDYVVSDTEAVMLAAWSSITSGAIATRARIPDDLLELIGNRAAVTTLDYAGSFRHEPGLSSESISSSGFSESMSYQTGERGGAYASIVKGLEARAADLRKGLRGTFAVRLGGVV